MRNLTIKLFLFIYTKIRASHKIKVIIKFLFGNKKLLLNYRNFKIHLGVNNSIQSNIIFNDYNEEFILSVIEKYVKLNYTFLDIGANVGVHTLTAASVNSTNEIYSFEPEPENFLELVKNVEVNNFKNVLPFKVAMGNQISSLMLNVNDGWNKGRHSLKSHITKVKRQVSVPVLKVDLFQESLKDKNLLLKIDVEGFEKEVLEGGNTVLNITKNSVLIIELVTEINSLEVCHEIVDKLKSLGFSKVYRVENNKMMEVNNYENSADYIFIKGQESLKSFLA